MTFAQPAFLLFLLLVPLVALAAWLASRQRTKAWQKLVAERLRPKLVAPPSPWSRWLSLGCGLLALTLMVVALAQPIAGTQEAASLVKGRNIIIAIDASRSMLASDVAPNRLAAAKTAAYDLLDRFPEDRIGLLAFAGSATLQAPLTVDHNALRETLDQLDITNVPTGGSNLADAVTLAIRNFQETGQKNHGLIVLSDGELHEGQLEDATFDARKAGVFVVSIGIGTREGEFVPDPEEQDGRFRDRDGNPVLTRLNAAPLRTLASSTSGLYLEGVGSGFGRKIDTVINRLDAFEDEGRTQVTPIPRYSLFLIPAMLLLIASLLLRLLWKPVQPKGIPAILAIFATLFVLAPRSEAKEWTNPLNGFLGTRALENDPEKALGYYQKALAGESEDASQSEDVAKLKYGEAAALYRLERFQEAGEAYGDALLSENPLMQRDAHHQLANSLYMRVGGALKEAKEKEQQPDTTALIASLEDAISHYESALTIKPDHKPTLKNKLKAKDLLEKLKKRQQEEKEQEEQKEGEDGEESEEDQESQEGDEQEEGEGGEPGEGEEPSEGDQNEGGENGDQGEDEQEDGGESGEEQQDDSQQSQDQKQQQKSQQPAPADDETAEEFARRILEQNADFQKEALRQRGREIRPNKDW